MSTATSEYQTVRLRPEDHVAVAVRPIPRGATVEVDGVSDPITTRDPIPPGHKVALVEIPEGAPVLKYGQVIGFANRPIPVGSHVHDHNLRADLFARDFSLSADRPRAESSGGVRTFRGYLRPDGRVGTRNYVVVISTVNCSASTSRMVADAFRDGAWRSEFPQVDGVFAITHKGGCGLPFGGPDHNRLERVLAGFANHPNVGAYVLIGLGCEVSYAQHIVEAQDLIAHAAPGFKANGGASPPRRPRMLNIQDEGGITKTVERGIEAVRRLMPEANAWTRTEQPASKIVMAMECGGSDGYSGVTANPALGVAADLVVAQGGSAVLGETTEIYGAEHLLAGRAVRSEVGQKLMDRIRWWEWYAGVFGAEINNNPSPGNKAGGLSTIYEKSLGALAKAGVTPLTDVVGYGEPVTTPGLVFMDTPGFDPPCTTGLVAGGANVLIFTTGRGSVLGLKPTPCIKVSTNTSLYRRMEPDMDLDAGTILDGESVESAGRRIFEMVLDVASGAPTKSERQGVGEEEFAPWHVGPTL